MTRTQTLMLAAFVIAVLLMIVYLVFGGGTVEPRLRVDGTFPPTPADSVFHLTPAVEAPCALAAL